MRLTAALLFVSSGLAAVIPGQLDARAAPLNPSVDPFYRLNSTGLNLSSFKNGAVIRNRTVDSTVRDTATQLFYRTQNAQGNPDASVATVWVPKNPSKTPKLLSYGVYEDAASYDCAPSFAFRPNSGSQGALSTSLDGPIVIEHALDQGYYVVSADSLGSQAAWISGWQEGYATLDAIKATIKYLNLPQDTPVIQTGYSGGGHISVWTARLAGSYAPEVNMIGAAHGGTPIDLQSILLSLNKGLFSGFAGAGLTGIANGYPEIDAFIKQYATADGLKAISAYRSSNYCLGSVVGGHALTDFFSYFTLKDPLNNPIPQTVFKRESLLANISSAGVPAPSFPTFQVHGLLDEIVPLDAHSQFVKEQCAAGANINYSLLLGDHILGEILGLLPTIQWIDDAFNGKYPASTCSSNGSSRMINPASYDANAILGPKLAAKYNALNGKQTPLGMIHL